MQNHRQLYLKQFFKTELQKRIIEILTKIRKCNFLRALFRELIHVGNRKNNLKDRNPTVQFSKKNSKLHRNDTKKIKELINLMYFC